MEPSKLWVCLFVLTLIASACGGGDSGDTNAQDSDQTSGEITSDVGGSDDGGSGDEKENGEGAPSASDTDFPEGIDDDFPVPVPAGWEIDIHEELAEQGVTVSNGGVQVLYSNDEFDRIIDFYDQWTEEDTVDYVRSEAGDSIIYNRMESPIYVINVTRNHTERDRTFTYLLITIPPG